MKCELSRRESLRVCVLIIKFLAIGGTIAMTIHVALLILGFNLPIAEEVIGIGFFPYIFAMIISYGFGFCRLHRALITYIYIVSCCIAYQRYLGFGEYLLYIRSAVLLVGIILIILTVKNKVNCKLEK